MENKLVRWKQERSRIETIARINEETKISRRGL